MFFNFNNPIIIYKFTNDIYGSKMINQWSKINGDIAKILIFKFPK